MTKHYLKISDDGKNLQLSITNPVAGVAITKLLIKKSDEETDYIDISDEIANAEVFSDTGGLTKYVCLIFFLKVLVMKTDSICSTFMLKMPVQIITKMLLLILLRYILLFFTILIV